MTLLIPTAYACLKTVDQMIVNGQNFRNGSLIFQNIISQSFEGLLQLAKFLFWLFLFVAVAFVVYCGVTTESDIDYDCQFCARAAAECFRQSHHTCSKYSHA